jgi:hypothetical protein
MSDPVMMANDPTETFHPFVEPWSSDRRHCYPTQDKGLRFGAKCVEFALAKQTVVHGCISGDRR